MNSMLKHQVQEMAGEYVSTRNIHGLFEALMTGLMIEKPDDHLQFLIDCLEKCRDEKEPIKWNQFFGKINKLPPIEHHTLCNSTEFDSKFFATCKIVSVVGAPGLNKHQHSEWIARKNEFRYVNVGELLRQLAEEKNDRGQEIDKYLKQGEFVPTNIVANILRDHLMGKMKTTNKLLLNGFPRDREQAEYLNKTFAPCSLVIYVCNSMKLIGQQLSDEANKNTTDDHNVWTNRRKYFANNSLPMMDKLEWNQTPIAHIDLALPHDQIYNDVELALSQFHFSTH